MAERAIAPIPKTYAELLRRVKETLFTGQRAADLAWVRTFHETGRLIHEHVMLKKDRADHGAEVIKKLSQDTGTDYRRLYECRQFYRCFPSFRLTGNLGWTRGLLLSQVADEEERKTLVAEVLKDDLPTDALKARVRALNAAGKTTPDMANATAAISKLLQPRRGTPGLHPIVDRGDGPAVDLGFKLYRALGAASQLAPGDIVRFDEDPLGSLGATSVRRVTDATRAQLFTYTATIWRVVDGDTLAVALLVAPGITLEMTLRLRGLDCPETSTAEGRAAKRFVEEHLRAGDQVILSTTKPDKYDRYLADVFVVGRPGGRANSATPRAEFFLNNALLEGGYAVRYDGGAKAQAG